LTTFVSLPPREIVAGAWPVLDLPYLRIFTGFGGRYL